MEVLVIREVLVEIWNRYLAGTDTGLFLGRGNGMHMQTMHLPFP